MKFGRASKERDYETKTASPGPRYYTRERFATDKQKISFTKGKRPGLHHPVQTPSCKYNVTDMPNITPEYSFSTQRRFKDPPGVTTDVPGPGHTFSDRQMDVPGAKLTMSGKTFAPNRYFGKTLSTYKNENPGPGQYSAYEKLTHRTLSHTYRPPAAGFTTGKRCNVNGTASANPSPNQYSVAGAYKLIHAESTGSHFGTAPRLGIVHKSSVSPGNVYNPNFDVNKPHVPAISMGKYNPNWKAAENRKNRNNRHSKANLGPGRYNPEKIGRRVPTTHLVGKNFPKDRMNDAPSPDKYDSKSYITDGPKISFSQEGLNNNEDYYILMKERAEARKAQGADIPEYKKRAMRRKSKSTQSAPASRLERKKKVKKENHEVRIPGYRRRYYGPAVGSQESGTCAPGPGTYEVSGRSHNAKITQPMPSFSIKGKFKNVPSAKTQTPAPNVYYPGLRSLSQSKKLSWATKWTPSNVPQKALIGEDSPGPMYNPKQTYRGRAFYEPSKSASSFGGLN